MPLRSNINGQVPPARNPQLPPPRNQGPAALQPGAAGQALPLFIVQWREQPACEWRDVCERTDAGEAFDYAEDIERCGGQVKVARRWRAGATPSRPQ